MQQHPSTPGRSRHSHPLHRGLRQTAAITVLVAAAQVLPPAQAQVGPLVCTTSLEAPIMATREASGNLSIPPSPVEVTRCAAVETVPQLMDRRAFSWTSPYARGVDMTHQITDILGIAMGGGDGSRVMGFGFPDQTLIWDGIAIRNTAYALMDLQSNPMPQRTPDLVSVFSSSLGAGRGLAQPSSLEEGGMPRSYLNPPLQNPAP